MSNAKVSKTNFPANRGKAGREGKEGCTWFLKCTYVQHVIGSLQMRRIMMMMKKSERGEGRGLNRGGKPRILSEERRLYLDISAGVSDFLVTLLLMGPVCLFSQGRSEEPVLLWLATSVYCMLQNTRANQIRVWTADSAVREDLTTDANVHVTTTAISVNMVFIGFDIRGGPKQ